MNKIYPQNYTEGNGILRTILLAIVVLPFLWDFVGAAITMLWAVQ